MISPVFAAEAHRERPSGIDRGAFDAWRADYWEHRAKDF